MNITFITADKVAMEGDDALLIKHIQDSFPNVNVEIKSFLDESVNWDKSSIINLKTAYGYYRYTNQFKNWLEKLQNINKKFLNPAPIILWNLDKFYLKELAKSGINTLPTIFVNQDEVVDLSDISAKNNWHKMVIKPAISAGGNGLFLCDATNSESLKKAQQQLAQIQKYSRVLVQEYNNSISKNGEYSAVFINSEYCYLIHKKPNDNFIASYSKGIEAVTVENNSIKDYAINIFNKISGLSETLYARIDLIEEQGKIYLMELELIEPRLFFDKVDPVFMEKYIKAQINMAA